MAKRKSRTVSKSKKKTKRTSKVYYEHIYFESKRPGRDSVYMAVRDIGKPGVRSSKEVGALAVAQFIDWLDGKTVNHYGEVVRFNERLWAGRTRILYLLAQKYGGKRIVNSIVRLKKMVEKGKLSKEKAKLLALKLAKKYKLPLVRTNL